jgi:hypothetical protein
MGPSPLRASYLMVRVGWCVVGGGRSAVHGVRLVPAVRRPTLDSRHAPQNTHHTPPECPGLRAYRSVGAVVEVRHQKFSRVDQTIPGEPAGTTAKPEGFTSPLAGTVVIREVGADGSLDTIGAGARLAAETSACTARCLTCGCAALSRARSSIAFREGRIRGRCAQGRLRNVAHLLVYGLCKKKPGLIPIPFAFGSLIT